jgi:hypothetical protein
MRRCRTDDFHPSCFIALPGRLLFPIAVTALPLVTAYQASAVALCDAAVFPIAVTALPLVTAYEGEKSWTDADRRYTIRHR